MNILINTGYKTKGYGSVAGFSIDPVLHRDQPFMNYMQLEARVSVCDRCFTILQSGQSVYLYSFRGELQRENKLISYERAFKMLENDMYIAGIGQAVLELLSFKVDSGNLQRGISLLQKFSDIFGNMRLVPLKMTPHMTSHNFQILKLEIFSKLCKI